MLGLGLGLGFKLGIGLGVRVQRGSKMPVHYRTAKGKAQASMKKTMVNSQLSCVGGRPCVCTGPGGEGYGAFRLGLGIWIGQGKG